jgi:hypothetical protein
VSRADLQWTRPRPRDVLAWSLLLACTLVLASLFQAVAGTALGGPATTTSVVAAGDDGQGRGPSCAPLFGSYNWWLFSSGRQGPCGLDPDAESALSVAQAPQSIRPVVPNADTRCAEPLGGGHPSDVRFSETTAPPAWCGQ